MDFLETIKNRRSNRNFIDKPLEKDLLYEIINAGRYAPSSGNLQNWKFIVIEKQKIKDKIANLALNQLWLGKASALVVVCVTPDKAKMYYGKHGNEYSIQNGVFAASNMLLAAEALGVASCYVAAFDRYGVKELLRVPPEAFVIGLVALGYSSKPPVMPTRYELESFVFLNSWGTSVPDFKYEILGQTSHFAEKGIEKMQKTSSKFKDKVKSWFKR